MDESSAAVLFQELIKATRRNASKDARTRRLLIVAVGVLGYGLYAQAVKLEKLYSEVEKLEFVEEPPVKE